MQIESLDFNAICLVHDSIFKFPSSYLMQDDTQEMIMRQEIKNQGRKVFNNEGGVKFFMADLNPKKE